MVQEVTQDYIPPTEGSLAVDPRAAVPAAIPAAEPIPFPDRRRVEPPQPPTGEGADLGRRRFLKGVLAVTAATAAGVAGYNPIQSFLRELDRGGANTIAQEAKPLGPQSGEVSIAWWKELTESEIKNRANIPDLSPILWRSPAIQSAISPQIQEMANARGYEVIYQADPKDTVGRSIAVRGREINEQSADLGFGRSNRTILDVRGIFQAWVPDPKDPAQTNHIYALFNDPVTKKEWLISVQLNPYIPNSDKLNDSTWFAVDNLDNGPDQIRQSGKGTPYSTVGMSGFLMPDPTDPDSVKFKKTTDFPTTNDLLRNNGLHLTDLIKPGDFVKILLQYGGLVEGKTTFQKDENGIAKAFITVVRRFNGGTSQWHSEITDKNNNLQQ